MAKTRRRTHRVEGLNQVEEEITKKKTVCNTTESDVALWRRKNENYRKVFHTKETWMQIRTAKPLMENYKGIWFKHSTPKYSFITWLVQKNRVTTGDKLIKWNPQATSNCILCQHSLETRDHLFFTCPYSLQVWTQLAKGILHTSFTANWKDILKLLHDKGLSKTKSFIVAYIFQNAVHSIWRERNNRRHNEEPSPCERLIRVIDKNIRNRLSTIRSGGEMKFAGGIQEWFESRQA